MAQSKGKYWIANNPNGEATDAKVEGITQLAVDLNADATTAGGDAATNGAVTEVLKITVGGVAYFIPIHRENA